MIYHMSGKIFLYYQHLAAHLSLLLQQNRCAAVHIFGNTVLNTHLSLPFKHYLELHFFLLDICFKAKASPNIGLLFTWICCFPLLHFHMNARRCTTSYKLHLSVSQNWSLIQISHTFSRIAKRETPPPSFSCCIFQKVNSFSSDRLTCTITYNKMHGEVLQSPVSIRLCFVTSSLALIAPSLTVCVFFPDFTGDR